MGHSIPISWTVRNQGTALQSTWYDRVYLSSDTTWSSQDVLVTNVTETRTLAPWTSYTETLTVTVPWVSAGSYYLLVRTDVWNNVTESDESNNVRTVPITVGIPDLTPTTFTAPPSALGWQVITPTWTIRNQGHGDAPPSWQDRIYLSTDITYDSEDTFLTTVTHAVTLSYNSSYTVTQGLTLPKVTPGSYYLLLKTDMWNAVSELDETNNVRVLPINVGPPDLTPTEFLAPSVAKPGQSIPLTWTVKNQGLSDTLPTWYDRVYLSTDSVWDSGDTMLVNVTRTFTLLPGTSYTTSRSANLPRVAPGTYYLIFRTDMWGNVVETDETNNEQVVPIVVGLPDLTPTSFSTPATGKPWQTVPVTWTVKNQGPIDALASWEDRVYLSTDAAWDSGDIVLAKVTHGAIVTAGDIYTTTANVTLSKAGTYYLILRTDVWGQVTEADETHNQRVVPIIVGLADLTPTTLIAPATGITGQSVPITWTVTNQGTGNAAPTWQDRVYLSTDNTWDSGDALLTTVTRTATLIAVSSYTVTQNVVLPNKDPGTYYLILRTDMSNQVAESDEGNNISISSISLASPPLTPTPTLCGTMSQSESWGPAVGPYVVTCNVTVSNGATLTLLAGTVVKFSNAFSLTINYGALLSQGTDGHPVVITSLKDDSVGGDTNNNGSATSPAGNDWGAIIVNTGGTASLTYTTVRYGGASSWYAPYRRAQSNLFVNGGSLSLDHATVSNSGADGIAGNSGNLTVQSSIVANNGLHGINVSGVNLSLLDSTLSSNGQDGLNLSGATLHGIQHATFSSNGRNGLVTAGINAGSLIDSTFTGNGAYAAYLRDSVLPVLAGNTGSGNGAEVILLSGSLSSDTTLSPNPNLPYSFDTLTVYPGVALTLQAGVIVKPLNQQSNLQIYGTLTANGTPASPVIVTSLKDDSVGGDTNNDASATSPAGYDWGFIQVNTGGTATLSYTTVRYGGIHCKRDSYTSWCEPNWANLFVNGGSLSLDHATVSDSGWHGIAGNSGNLWSAYSTISNNTRDSLSISLNQAWVRFGNITGNGGYGVYNGNQSNAVNATENWWGAGSGPYHPTLNPQGAGAEVRERVSFEPWADQKWQLIRPSFPPGPSLIPDVPSTMRGGAVTVWWNNIPSPGGDDHIGLYRVGDVSGFEIARKSTYGSASGFATFILPGQEGSYEFRFTKDDGSVAASCIVSVTSQGQPSLSTLVTKVTFDDSVDVYWSGIANPTPGDWIGLFDRGAPDTSPRYTATISGPSGSTSFVMPSTQDDFEFRLFADGSYARLAQSSVVTVAPYRVLVLLAGMLSSTDEVLPAFESILDNEVMALYDQRAPVLFSYNDDYSYLSGDTLNALGSPSPYGLYDHRAVYALHNTVQRILADQPHAQIDLMGHSLGGAVAFLYLKEYASKNPSEVRQIKHLVTLDSPINGDSQRALTLLGEIVFDSTTARFLDSKQDDLAWRHDNYAAGYALVANTVIRTITSEQDNVVLTDRTYALPDGTVVGRYNATLHDATQDSTGRWVDVLTQSPFEVILPLGYGSCGSTWLDPLGHGQVLCHPTAIEAIKIALITPPPQY